MKYIDDIYVIDYNGKKIYFSDNPIRYQEIIRGHDFKWHEKLPFVFQRLTNNISKIFKIKRS